MSRGVLYLVWKGDSDPTASFHRSIASLQHWHPELEHRVVYMPDGSNLLVKSQMFDLSPFDETLFLDADTTVMGKLGYGFIKAKQHGIACCISANPWNRRYQNIEQHPDEVEYSSGVVFFDKSNPRAADVFDRWNYLSRSEDSSTEYPANDGIKTQPFNDQALFSLAMQRPLFNPFVLPLNWNLYPKWQNRFFGEVKILHGTDDIPPTLVEWNKDQSREGAKIRCGKF